MQNKNKLYFVALGVCLLLGFYFLSLNWEKSLPRQKEINQFLDKLEYSVLEDVSRPDFYLKLNFDFKVWKLKNLFSYLDDGRLLNHKSLSGTCKQLTQVTYDFVKPWLEEDYEIIFAKGYEEKFFRDEAGAEPSHYFLKLIPRKEGGKSLIIDPTYRIYAYREEVKGHLIVQESNYLHPFLAKERDLILPTDVNYPLLFLAKKGQMFSLLVRKIETKYDQNNHAVGIFFHKQYQVVSQPLFVLMVQEGELLGFKNQDLIAKIDNREVTDKLSNLVLSLFENRRFD